MQGFHTLHSLILIANLKIRLERVLRSGLLHGMNETPGSRLRQVRIEATDAHFAEALDIFGSEIWIGSGQNFALEIQTMLRSEMCLLLQ